MRQPVPTEHWEQVQLFAWSENLPELKLMHAIPNGGKRDIRVAIKLKEEGVKAGVPDIFLPLPRGGKHGLFIELKRRKYGRVSPEQLYWLDALMREEYACSVCHGREMARDVILDYLRSGTDDKHTGHQTGGTAAFDREQAAGSPDEADPGGA